VLHSYAPYDLPAAVRRFLRRVRPVLAVFMETELWPNTIALCAAGAIPLVVANARLSERSARGYRRFGPLVRPMLQGVSAVAAQTEDDARRLVGIGVPAERVVVSGSLKFDLALPASLRERAEVLRRDWGADRGVWIAASTHEGEEEIVLAAHAEVLRQLPDTLLVLVPRHPERFSRVAALARRRGYATVLRSDGSVSASAAQVFVGDSMGELPLFYAACDVAFVGGSLVPVGGHNLLEPAALGLPVLSGAWVFNFAEVTRLLEARGAARRVRDARELAGEVVALLGDAGLRHAMGLRGQAVVDENRGALGRLLAILAPYLPGAT
jgi:3-deoxy-D-manno-octulosonic-acid transferase